MPRLPPASAEAHLPRPPHAQSLYGAATACHGRAFALVLVLASSAPTGDGGDYRNLGPLRRRGVEPLREPNVFLGDVDVDEAAQRPLLVDDPGLDAGKGGLQRVDDLRQGRAVGGDVRLVLGVRTQDRGDSDVDAHGAPRSGTGLRRCRRPRRPRRLARWWLLCGPGR